MSELILTGEH